MIKKKYVVASSLITLGTLSLFLFQNFTPATKAPEKFKIIWHLGIDVEPLADLKNTQVLDNIKSKVDGYYVLVVNNGSLLTYWQDRPGQKERPALAGRPIECRLNFKNFRWENKEAGHPQQYFLEGKTFRLKDQDGCEEALKNYQTVLWKESIKSGSTLGFNAFREDLHLNALKRVFKNLDLKGEQSKGKKVMAEMLLVNNERAFFYNPKADKLKITVDEEGKPNLPGTYAFLRANGIKPDRMMVYQEPRIQQEHGNLLEIPLHPGEATNYVPGVGQCEFCLPQNLRVLNLVEEAFQRINIKAPNMAINIRTWDEDQMRSIKRHLRNFPDSKFDGINVEGSSNKMDKSSYDRSIEGIAWMMLNSSKPISLLVPGSLDHEILLRENTQEERDENTLNNFLKYVTSVNEDLNKELKLPKGKNAICDERINIIVGSYGSPLHMDTLPLYRRDSKGNLANQAGTVASEIMELSRLRDRLCR